MRFELRVLCVSFLKACMNVQRRMELHTTLSSAIYFLILHLHTTQRSNYCDMKCSHVGLDHPICRGEARLQAPFPLDRALNEYLYSGLWLWVNNGALGGAYRWRPQAKQNTVVPIGPVNLGPEGPLSKAEEEQALFSV